MKPTRNKPAIGEVELPPHDVRIEGEALGIILDDPSGAAERFAQLQPGYFYDERHGAIYRALAACNGNMTPDAMLMELKKAKEPPAIGSYAIGEMMGYVTSLLNWGSCLDILKDYSRRRDVVRMAGEVQELASDISKPPGEIDRLFVEYTRAILGLRNIQPQPLNVILAANESDPDELINRRFLCRGGALLLVGPTGIGKSSLAMQLMLCWALGKTCFGLHPARPLKSLLIQAENDNGDLAEMRDGVLTGLGFSETDKTAAPGNVFFATVDDCAGIDFVGKIFEPLIHACKPDLVWLDPLLAYLGGDVSRQEIVSQFLRNAVNPVLHRHHCGAVVVHHTNKPPKGEEKRDWQAGDFAYLGSGSADLANWARAVLAVRSIGRHDVFELRAGKRGNKLGWVETDGRTRSYARFIGHAPGDGIFWREVDPADVPAGPGGRPPVASLDSFVALLKGNPLSTGDWKTAAKDELGTSERSFFRMKQQAINRKLATKSAVNGKWMKND